MFAISSVDAASSSTTTPRKMIEITCPTRMIRSRSLRRSRPSRCPRAARGHPFAIASTSCGRFGVTSNACGQRVVRQVLDELRRPVAHDLERLFLRDELDRSPSRADRARGPLHRRRSAPRVTSASHVCSVQKKTFTCTLALRPLFDHDSTHEPSAIATPSRNIPISTVIVAANVVERLARIDRSASRAASGTSFARVPPAPLVARELAVLEREHAPAHLVDHLAVVRDHQDRRARTG